MKMRRRRPLGSIAFDVFNYTVLTGALLVALVPFLYILACSFSTDKEISTRIFYIIPHKFTLEAYQYIFSSSRLVHSIYVTFVITVGGTLVNLFFTLTMAYALSKKYLPGRNIILNCIIVTMVFSGGLIPEYILVKNLNLIDTYWSVWLPVAISTANLIIIKNYFQEMDHSLEDAAKIDGCSELQLLWKIVIPLSKPIIATFTLFYAVGHWNAFMEPLLYLNDNNKWPLQIILREIVILSESTLANTAAIDSNIALNPPQESMKMAVIIVATLPILCFYPFVQKYFKKGIMIGAVKG